MSDVVSINKQIATITKGRDRKDDALMMMSAECNWSQLLTPAPYSIALLGQLILISTSTDFTLEENPPKDGFKLLRYPNSFRASLVQVSNGGWNSFNLAHTNMDQIRLHCNNVDSHLRTAVRFLFRGTPAEVEYILEKSLKKVQRIADECLSLSTEVEKSFVHMMQLIGELLEASTNTKSVYENKIKETKLALTVASTEQARLEENLKVSEERLKKMDTAVDEAQSEFKDAMESIPSGAELFGLQMGDLLVGTIRSVVSFGTDMVTGLGGQLLSLPGSIQGVSDFNPFKDGQPNNTTAPNSNPGTSSAPTSLDDSVSTHTIYIEVGNIYGSISTLGSLATSSVTEGKRGPDWNRISNGGTKIIKMSMENSLSRITAVKGGIQLRMRVSSVCTETISICDELTKYSKSLAATDKPAIERIISRIDLLQNEIMILNTEAQRNNGANPLDRQSPFLSKMQPQGSDGSLAQSAVANARFKTTVAKETLKDAKRRQEKTAEQVQEINERLTTILVEMSKLEIEKVDFDKIREVLVKGIFALAELREQWGKLVHFFQMLANIIKCCLNTSLTAFVDEAKIGRELKIANKSYKLSNIFRDVIFEHAAKCSQVSFIVYTIASTYVDISNKHIMPKITGLSRLIALDPEKDKSRICQEREKLFSNCKTAQAAIKRIAERQVEEYHYKIDKRIAKITKLEKELPPMDEQKEMAMKVAVAGVFKTDLDDDSSSIEFDSEDEDDLF